MTHLRSLGAALALLLLPAAQAHGAPKAENGRAAAFQAVLDCRDVADSAARLACYDAAAGRMSEAERKGDIVVVDRATAAAAHREAFGLPVPSLDFLTKAMKPSEVDQLEGVVRSARADIDGHWTLALEDGAVWRQIDGNLGRDPKAGSKVVIRKGAIGSFLMNVDGQHAVKVHRDR